MGPENVIQGDNGGMMPPQLPQAQADDTQLKELQEAAKFAKSKHYKELKAHLDRRIDFYQKYLPDGTAIGTQPDNPDTARMWIVANVIIAEIKAVTSVYDNAAEMLQEYTEGRATS